MAQSVEHVIGNDEVISSILITSSKISNPIGLLIFYPFFDQWEERHDLHAVPPIVQRYVNSKIA